ncbi:tetratricopeptide repeat protein, partial [Candidatus Magnetaquicoccus inordinatus]|uniref:tetratricopeptide repeat-containing glycosyltransferase family protein n=1 Tax=Candidatus Magnetaquicoccus inordinatus TaxID=2496818 RepID=UPI00187D16B4
MTTPALTMEPLQEIYRLHQQALPQQALQLALQQLEKGVYSPTLLNMTAVCSLELGLSQQAESLWQTTLQLYPDFTDALANLGFLYQEQGRWPEAEQAYRTALQRQPAQPQLHGNLATLLLEWQRFPEAEAHLHTALQLEPQQPTHWYNLGNLAAEQERFAEAETYYRQALQLQPDHPDAAWNYSLFLLQAGRFQEGWPLYESRYHPQKKERVLELPQLPFPFWQGENLHGRSLLIIGEQGFGDEIQFSRFLPLLKQLHPAHLTLACKEPLLPLLQTVAGVDQLLPLQALAKAPRHDYWTFLLSLPGQLKITLETIPTNLPYLHPLPQSLQRWQPHLQDPRMKIGLLWQGSPAHRNDRHRSIPHIQLLQPLWNAQPNCAWFSLQSGEAVKQLRDLPPTQPLLSLGEQIENFADSAAIVRQLDLVITVDTAMAHLCGALATPCWVLLPRRGTDWRC